MSVPSLLVSHWRLAWQLDAAAAVYAALYLYGARRVRAGWPLRRTLAFLTGIGCVLVALQSGVESFDDRLLSAHMAQHMLLLMVAPPFLVAARPLLLALRALPPRRRPAAARAVARWRRVTGPWQCLAFFCVAVLATHVPAFYEATLRHPLLHDFEHALYLLAGSLLFWPLLDGDPAPARRLGGIARLIYVLAAMLPMAIVGPYLNRATSLVYHAYAGPAGTMGISAVRDQAEAGAIMWVAGNTIMIAVGLWAVLAALVAEERRQQARDARDAEATAAHGARL